VCWAGEYEGGRERGESRKTAGQSGGQGTRGEGRETERRADIHARVHIIERQRGMELERWQGIRGSRGKGGVRRKTRRKE